MMGRVLVGPTQKGSEAILQSWASGAGVILVVVDPEPLPNVPPDIKLELPDPLLGSLEV